jgi:hypothetical protein
VQIVTNKNFLELATYMRISSIATRFLREVLQTSHIFSITRLPPTSENIVFAYSTLTAQYEPDQLSSFDTYFSFWVCDNLATGHYLQKQDVIY